RAVTMTGGIRGMNDIRVSDPKKYIEANLAMLESMSGGEGRHGAFKDVKIERDAKTHEGMTFTHVAVTLDMDKLAQLGGNNPAQRENLKAMFGGEKMEYWYGTDGKRLLELVSSSWEDAKAQADAYVKGTDGIGASSGFKNVRSQLPDRASLLLLL